MQTPKTRISSLEVPQRTSPTTPRTARQLKAMGSDSDSVQSPNAASRTPKDRSPKVVERKSPRTRASDQKKPPSKVSEIAQLQEELKKAKNQLSSSESCKKQAQEEAEEAKKQLAATSAMLKDSQQQLTDLSDSDDARVQELRKISQERDRAWQSELEALQKQHSMDSAALSSAMNEIQKLKMQLERMAESEATQAKYAESADTEIQNLRLELEETLSLVENTKIQLRDCKESESRALEFVSRTQLKLDLAKEIEHTLRSDGFKAMEAYKTLSVELEQSKEELNKVNVEVDELRSALDSAERRYQEEYIQSTLQIRSAYELAENTKLEASQKEAELNSMLTKATTEIEEVKVNLMARETELRSIFKDNVGKNLLGEEESVLEMEFKVEADFADLKASLLQKENELKKENEAMKFAIKKREVESIKAKDEALALAESAKATEREARLKLGFLTEEADRSSRKVAYLTGQLEASQAANSDMEAEMRRLKVQSDQWRKAAEAAAAMLSTGNNNGKFVERTGSLDSHTIGGKLGSPFSEDLDDESPKKKNANVFKKISVMLKKGQK